MRARWFKTSVLALLISTAASLQAQISVTAGGAGPIDFSVAPPASEWSTRDFTTGDGDANTYQTPAQVDAGARTNSAALINLALSPDGNYGTGRLGRHNNTVGNESVYTQPTGVPAAIIMATMRNDAGDNIISFTVSYTYNSDPSIPLPSAGEQAQAPGFRVLWSLSGAPQTWNVITNLSGVTNAGTVSATLEVAGWASGANMYLLWYDDNSNTNPDGTNTIDNFAISSVVTGPIPCPGITAEPVSITRQQCFDGAATFSITATGAVQGVQWYRQESGGGGFNPIAGANGTSYSLSSYTVGADNGAQFQAVVTNSGCARTSSVATLTVIADTTPPSALYAYVSTNRTNITIFFSEPIVTNNLVDVPGNFILTDTNTATQLGILAALAPNNRTLVLETDPLDPTHGFTLTMDFVTDECAALVADTITLPVNSFISTPLSLFANWRFLDNDIDPAANWFQAGFDDSGWSSGTGPFDAKRNAGGAGINCRPPNSFTNYFTDGTFTNPHTCINLESPVTLTNLITTYFRTTFNYSGNTNETLLELQAKFDDGAVVYLNGVELTRLDLPAAPAIITDTTLAGPNTVGDAEREDIIRFYASTNLRTGQNLIAVELHQQSLTSSDLTMGLRLIAYTLEQLAEPATLKIVNNGDGTVTITWAGGGTLEETTDLNSPISWTPVPGSPTSPYTFTPTGPQKFYRVTQ